MKLKEELLSDKKKLVLLISVILLTGGLIPLIFLTFSADFSHPYTITEIQLESEDQTELKALKFTPNRNENGQGIVVAHGFCGNKHYMQAISIELVKRGITVLSIDFRGHGSSDGYLTSLRRTHENNPLIGDVMAGVKYLEELGISEIGLVGHSMGGRTSLLVSEKYPEKIEAIVSIGMIEMGYNYSRISNLMMAIGNYEQIFSESQALEYLREYTDQSEVEIGKLYGNFNQGDATQVIKGPYSEHLAEVTDPAIVYETVQWFEQAFNGKRADDVNLTVSYQQLFFYISIAGITILCFLGIIYLKNFLFHERIQRKVNPDFKEKSPLFLALTFIGGSTIGFIVFLYPFSLLFAAVLPVSMGHILYASIVGMTIGFLVSYYLFFLRNQETKSWKTFFIRMRERISYNPYKSIGYGIILGFGMTLALTSIMHWSTNTSFLTLREIGVVFGIVLLFFPFLLIKEFYLRSIQEQLQLGNPVKEYFSMVGLGIVLDNLLIIGLALLTWQNPSHDLGFIALSMSAIFIISVIQHFLVTWVYMYSGRNILGSTLFYCILYGWMIVNFFPFGINSGFF